MSDKRPIDQLRQKDASELSLTDYLLGHDNGAPAGYRTQLGEIAESESFLDALAGGLISRIIGPASPSDLENRVTALEGLGLIVVQKRFATTNPATLYFTDDDIPRNGAGLALISGNNDGGALLSWYRRGSFNTASSGLPWGATKGFGGTGEPSTGTYRFWVEDQTAGARLVVRAHTSVGRTITFLALETPT